MHMATEDTVFFFYYSLRCNLFFCFYCAASSRKGEISAFYGFLNDRFEVLWGKSEINCNLICVGGGSC